MRLSAGGASSILFMKGILLVSLLVSLIILINFVDPISAGVASHYEKAKGYYREAESCSNIGQACPLYENAIKEAQWALDYVSGYEMEEMKKIIIDSRKKKSDLDEVKRKAKAEGKIIIGMTKGEVIAIWGKPNDVNRSIYGSSGPIEEQWVYKRGEIECDYIYFKDDILTAIQYH